MRRARLLNGAALTAGATLMLVPALPVIAAQQAPPASPPAGQAPAPGTSTLPPGAGHDTVARVCVGCHQVSIVTSQHKSADDWATTVIEMRNRGASATDAELEEIVGYLATNFGPVAGSKPPATQP